MRKERKAKFATINNEVWKNVQNTPVPYDGEIEKASIESFTFSEIEPVRPVVTASLIITPNDSTIGISNYDAVLVDSIGNTITSYPVTYHNGKLDTIKIAFDCYKYTGLYKFNKVKINKMN